MNLKKRIQDVITDPQSFYYKIRKEKGLSNAVIYLLILSVIPAVLGGIVTLITSTTTSRTNLTLFEVYKPLEYFFSFPGIIFWILISYVMAVLFTFVVVFLLHAWLAIFGAQGGFDKTFQVYVYSNTPNFLFSWIPFVSFATFIWSVVLLVVGTREIKGLSTGKAALAYVLPLVLLIFGIIMLLVFLLTGAVVAFS